MPTAAQEIAALKRAVKQLESRLDAIERPKLDDLERIVKEGFSDHNALIDVLTQGARTDRILGDRRYDALVARMDASGARQDQQHAEIKALGEDFEELKVTVTNGFARMATRGELADARAEIATTRIEIATMRTQVADLRTAMNEGFERVLAALPKAPD